MSRRPDGSDGQTATLREGLLRLAGGTLVLKVAGQALLFVVMVVLARLLGDRSYGQYVYALAWLRILVLVAKAGYDTAVLRFLPAYGIDGRWDLARGLLRTTFVVTVAAWLALALGVTVTVRILGTRLEEGLAPTLLLAAAVVLVQALVEQGMSVLRSWNRPLQAVLPNFVLRPLLVAGALVAGLFLVGLPRTSTLAMGAMGVASTCCLVLIAIWCVRAAPQGMADEGGRAHSPAWAPAALTMLFVSGIQMVLTQIDTIMVGSLLDATRAGYYGTASRLAGLTAFGATAAYTVVAPRIAAAHAAGDRPGLQAMLDTTSRAILSFAGAVALVLFVGGRWILGLWGDAFVTATVALNLLAVANLVNACGGPTGYIMTMTGHERTAALVLTGAVLLNLALNALLIPHFELVGAGSATLATLVAWNVVIVTYARRRVGVSTTILWPRRPGS